MTGTHLDEFGLIHPDDRETVQAAIDALERGPTTVLCNRNCHKNGSVIYCE